MAVEDAIRDLVAQLRLNTAALGRQVDQSKRAERQDRGPRDGGPGLAAQAARGFGHVARPLAAGLAAGAAATAATALGQGISAEDAARQVALAAAGPIVGAITTPMERTQNRVAAVTGQMAAMGIPIRQTDRTALAKAFGAQEVRRAREERDVRRVIQGAEQGRFVRGATDVPAAIQTFIGIQHGANAAGGVWGWLARQMGVSSGRQR